MIYLVTANKELFPNEQYSIISVEESLKLLAPLKEVGLDTETSGIDAHTNNLLLVQLGCFDFQVVIDCRTIDITLYKGYFEDPDRVFLGWNLKFDIKFLLKFKIVIQNIYDGYLAERLLWLGYPAGMHSLSLKAAGENYLGINLDKSVRGKIIWSKVLTNDIIIYGANDVKYLKEIKEKQLEELKKKDLTTALAYENKFCPVLAYTEYCGVKLDVEKWRDKMRKDQEKFDLAKTQLDNWVTSHFPDSKYTYIDRQGDLFLGFDLTPKCTINWSSPKQVAPFLQSLGFNLETYDKKTKEKKISVGSDIIEKQKNVSDIAEPYLAYKEAEKLIGTYGQNVLDQINLNTGRIHTNFNQCGADTLRLSSGGKDKENHTEYINFQNFPRDAETRSCFIAEEGFKWISADFSAQESRIMADLSADTEMINAFKNNIDIHSLVACKAYKDIIGDCPVEEVKSKFKEYRQLSKSVEFAIAYGGNASTIQRNNNIPLEEAERVYNDYMTGFPGVKRYQDKQAAYVMSHGYILLSDKTKAKAFIYDFDDLKAIESNFNSQYWDTYREYKKNHPGSAIVEEVRHYFRRKSDSVRQAVNYKIQGTAAASFKLASIWLYKYLLDNNLLFKVKLCIPAHDEWNIEVPEEIADVMSHVLCDCMKRAGEYFCPSLEFPVEAEISQHWVH